MSRNRLTPAARRHLPRLLAAGWTLQVTPAHHAHGVDWPQSVTLERPPHPDGPGDSNFEARGRTLPQAIAVARGTSRAIPFWVPGETSGADFDDSRRGGHRRRRHPVDKHTRPGPRGRTPHMAGPSSPWQPFWCRVGRLCWDAWEGVLPLPAGIYPCAGMLP